MHRITGAIKDYDWGIVDGLAPWSTPTGGPQAELWFGAHPAGPAPLIDEHGVATGAHLGEHFDIAAVPLLVKLLAAARPLSVQVHPRRELAERGFRTAAPGVFTDPFEKTELLVALTGFEALCDWRPIDEAVAILAHLPGTEQAVQSLRSGDRAAAIRTLLAGATEHQIAALPGAVDPAEREAYAQVAAQFPTDPGALLTPLLRYLQLAPGAAVFVPAGVPHSYLRGIGLEVMTSSDNVMRLGLTHKAVEVDHALAALDVDARAQVLNTGHGDVLAPAGAPFSAQLITDAGVLPGGRYRVVLVIEGVASIDIAGERHRLTPGSAAVVGADEPTAQVSTQGLVALVTDTAGPGVHAAPDLAD